MGGKGLSNMLSWGPFLTYMLVTAITPGPNNLMSLSHGCRLGFRRALPFNLGIWAGFSVVIVLCTLCSALLTALIPGIKFPMLMVGAAYMLYLAWGTFHSTGEEVSQRQSKEGFLSGLLLQFVNPKIYIYGIVSMEAYMLPFYHGQPVMLLLFALLLAFVGFACTLCWSAFGAVFQRLFSTHAKVVNTVLALLLVYCAVSLFFN